ncbi:MAG TPA: ATP synthase F1 subunit delta [Ktedonobacterales bacterium]|nr:ATP synthase F1 subunit delta [Ktedonobacterales bacterium]
MLKGATARRYAEAAFELGVEENTVDRWLQDLRLIADYFSDHRLIFLLSEPNIQLPKKELMVKDLLDGKVQQEALNLALLLVERGLVELAPRIRDEFARKYDDYHHQIRANLTTAMPIDDVTRAGVVADLQRLTGKKVLLDEQVDSSILGGAIARVGDTLIDGSVRRRLQLLRQQLQRGGMFTSQMDGVTGASASNGAGTGVSTAETPLVVTPPEQPDESANGGPATATEMAPRRGQSPHMAPRPAQPPTQSSSNQSNQSSNSSKNRNNSRKRGRRR